MQPLSQVGGDKLRGSALHREEGASARGRSLAVVPAGRARSVMPTDLPPPVKIGYAREIYAVPDRIAELPSDLDALLPLGDPCHYRMLAAKSLGIGFAEFCALSDGLFVHVSDMNYDATNHIAVSAPNMLRVRIASDGNCQYRPAQGDQLDMVGPGAAIIIEPDHMPPAEAVFSGHNRAAHVYVHRTHLAHLFAGREQELPPLLQDFVAGRLQQTVARRLPLSSTLLRCVEDLQGDTLVGHSRRLLFGSKVLEILCHTFNALAQEDSFGSPEASALTTRGVLKAKRLLTENFVAPPSLDVLAQQVGLSRSGLCAGFRQIVGKTVFDFVADLRMQHALAMLNERNASITQIAYAVGYSHPSSFTLAVQRRFGTTPSDLRRRGVPAG